MAKQTARWLRLPVGALLGLALWSACTEQPPTGPLDAPDLARAAGSTGPTVTATDPVGAPQDTTLDVRVLGSGFDRGSRSEFALSGVVGPNIRTNRTTYVSGKELLANITIAADAAEAKYDVIVTTSTGKKGIGTERFSVLAIELLPTGTTASDVNGGGQVAGSVSISSTCSTSATRPMVWTAAAGVIQLPVPSGACKGSASLINNNGVVVGSVDGKPYRWLPGGPGTWTPEPMALGGDPWGMNDAGDLAVLRSEGSPVVWKPTVWTPDGGVMQLASLPGAGLGCTSYQVNNLRQVVGRCLYLENNNLTPVVWTSLDAAPTVLPQLPGVLRSSADAINDAGIIAGLAMPPNGGKHAVRWVPNGANGWTVEDLGSLGGDSEVRDINNRGEIIGISQAVGSNYHGFIWDGAFGMRDLGTLGSQGSQASNINDPGPAEPTLVVGWSYISTKQYPVLWHVH